MSVLHLQIVDLHLLEESMLWSRWIYLAPAQEIWLCEADVFHRYSLCYSLIMVWGNWLEWLECLC